MPNCEVQLKGCFLDQFPAVKMSVSGFMNEAENAILQGIDASNEMTVYWHFILSLVYRTCST